MTLGEFSRLCVQAGVTFANPGNLDGSAPSVWLHHLSSNAVNRDILRNLLSLSDWKTASGCEFGVVTIRPPGVDDTDSWYAVTILEDMSGLLVRAGYGRLGNE